MRQLLRKVSAEALPTRVLFLREKAEMVSQGRHALDKLVRFIAASLKVTQLREPQTACCRARGLAQ
ncbi:hypothetical protein PPGU19_099650 (plasmid) [Paraburkholderia sp. PGU19]|nr:hypothetical protein PPGU19_099650 [Paraburkholderia sp. PGU19]